MLVYKRVYGFDYCNDSDLIPRSSAKTWGHLMEILGKATGSPKKYEEMLGME